MSDEIHMMIRPTLKIAPWSVLEEQGEPGVETWWRNILLLFKPWHKAASQEDNGVYNYKLLGGRVYWVCGHNPGFPGS